MSNKPRKILYCVFCGNDAVLIEDAMMGNYYYHYSTDYDLGCHQRIEEDNEKKMMTLSESTWRETFKGRTWPRVEKEI